MKRYLVVEGKEGVLVCNPHVEGRWVGQQIKAEYDPKKSRPTWFEPIKVVIESHPDLLKNIKSGLLVHHDTIVSESMDSAMKEAGVN